jgi:arylsulfatase A-like enzyme
MRRFLPLLALLLAAASLASAAETPAKPNIIIILADDLGWGDLSCYGNPSIHTPNLDRMAAEGMRFTDFYASAEVCTPSRTGLITGRFAIRSGMAHDQFRVLRRQSAGGLPAEEITIAKALKPAGYATACIGKWHLGNYMNVPAYNPRHYGFDFYFGLPHSNDMNGTPKAPRGAAGRLDQDPEWWAAPLFRNEELIEQPADQTTLTKRYTAEAVKFIGEHKSTPFFLYLAHTFPHVPLFASKDFSGKSERGLYGDVVEEVDWSVGQLLETLRHEGLEKNTLVFFTSDNGPWLIEGLAGGSAGMLRDGKGSTFEGGMREPGIAWWPGRIKAGEVTHEMGCNVDLFTTALALGGVAKPADRPIDGVDLSPILFGTGKGNREAMFYYRGTQLYAVRKGLYKAHYLTAPAYGPGSGKPEKHDPPLLYQLGQDPGEQHDVAAEHPEVLAEIAKVVEEQNATVTPVKNQLVEVMP